MRQQFYVVLLSFFVFIYTTVLQAEKDAAPSQFSPEESAKKVIPQPLPLSRYGNPSTYAVNGRVFTVLSSYANYHAIGYASWYGMKFHGQRTSSGEPYDLYQLTAASPVLPIPSFVKVTNLSNHKTIIVKVNDRGPFHGERILDLSYAAARKLDMLKKGTALVEIQGIDTGIDVAKTMHRQYVQVAAFSNPEYANALLGRLNQRLSYPIKIVNKDPVTLYRVLLGPVDNQGAKKLLDTLERYGLEGFVVRG